MSMWDDILSFAITVVVCFCFTISMQSTVKETYSDYMYGFGGRVEKSAMRTRAHDYEPEMKITKADVLLSLAIADEYTPKPAVYDVDGVRITVNNSFLKGKVTAMKPIINNGVSEANDYELNLKPGNDEPDSWVFERK